MRTPRNRNSSLQDSLPNWYGARDLLRTGWVDFVKILGNRVGGWQWFSTWTFRVPPGIKSQRDGKRDPAIHPEGARRLLRKLQHLINRKVYGVRYTKRPGEGMSSIVAMELQKRGVVHFHTIDAGVKEFRRLDAMDLWEEMAGFARVYPFREQGGAEKYVTKYLLKGAPWLEHNRNGGDIFLSGPFSTTKRSRLPKQL